MSSLFFDNFDKYGNAGELALRYATRGSIAFSSTAGRFGGGAFVGGGTNACISAPVTGNPSAAWLGFAFNPTGSNSEFDISGVTSLNGPELEITYNYTTATFRVFNNNNGSFIGAGSTVLLNSEWNWIDIFVELSTSASGSVQIWLNNAEVMNLTGIQTAFNASDAISLFCVSGAQGNAFRSSFPANYCDVAINDLSGSSNNGRIGDSRVLRSLPTADAGPNNGTPSTSGPHYAMVDAANLQTTNSIDIVNTTGQAEAFDVASLTVTPVAVYAVQVLSYGVKTDAGSAAMQQYVKSGTATANGPTQELTTTPSLFASIFPQDPNTSAAWTPSAVDDVIAGYQVQ